MIYVIFLLQIRKSDEDLLVLERFYPRRRSYAFVLNFGRPVGSKLWGLYYGGMSLSTKPPNDGYVTFDNVTLPPMEPLIMIMDM